MNLCATSSLRKVGCFPLTGDVDLAGLAGSDGVVDAAGVGAEVAAAGPHGQRAHGARPAEALRQSLVVEAPAERDVIRDGVRLTEQKIFSVLLCLADHALRLVWKIEPSVIIDYLKSSNIMTRM